jgi:hypothetical protein
MMICSKCGTDNPLGRVFCGSCGARLDLTLLTTEDIHEKGRIGFFAKHKRKLIVLPLLLVLAVAGTALWPQTKPLGAAAATRAVDTQRKIDQLAAAGGTMMRTFEEAELNRYLAGRVGPGESCSVDLGPNVARLRLVRSLANRKVLFLHLRVRVSFDLTLDTRAGNVRVAGASVGHLPLVGPLSEAALWAYRPLLKDWQARARAKSIKVTCVKDQAVVQVSGG